MLLGKKPIGTIAYMGGMMSIPEPFAWSWSQMIEFNSDYLVQPGEYIYYTRATASYHSFARNILASQTKGDWILMLDCDHEFEPDIASRMLYLMLRHNIDVLVGTYLYKQQPYSPKLYKWDKKKETTFMIGDWDKNVEIFEVDSSGAGCLLVKRSVFDRIRNELKQEPFDITFPFSEDHSFFLRLRKLKIKTYCAPKIEYPHLMYKTLTLKDYDKDDVLLSKRFQVEGRR